jgi:ribosomal subunit interface protein
MKGVAMQIYIEGQHTDVQSELRERITQRLEELNAQHDDILHARVALDKDTHHQQGADEVRITLSLAGKMLTARKTATTLYDAANAAMETIDRELRRFREQRQEGTQARGPRISGRVVKLFGERQYGFVETETYAEVFFHADAVRDASFDKLEIGMVMDLEIESGEKGPQAARITPRPSNPRGDGQ